MIKINESISVIIPAYNEAKNVSRVLKVLEEIKWIDEIIVVDDCSADTTALVAQKFQVKVLKHDINLGKGGAMATGVKAAKYDLLLFLDADLIGLKEDHLLSILSPIIFYKKADLSLGVFSLDEITPTNFANRVFPSITGQRAIRKNALPPLEKIAKTRYGVDLFISRHIPKPRRAVVKLKGLTQVIKEKKNDDIVAGLKSRFKMYKEILKLISDENKAKKIQKTDL
jgi:glycosyltransferase involved in cell wall biosynthesis